VGWTVAGSIVGQGGSFAGSVVAARVLGKEAYGQVALVQSTVVALSSLACLGLGVTATKYVSQYRQSDPEKAGRILGLSSIVALIAALCFSAFFILAAPSLVIPGTRSAPDVAVVRLGAVFLFFTTLNGYQMGAMAGLEAFRSIAAITAVCGVASFSLAWWFSTCFGLRGAVLSQGVSAFLLWSFYQAGLNRESRAKGVHVSCRGSWGQRWALFRFSVPGTISGIISSSAIWWCGATLVRNCGYAELALFTAANNMRLMILLVPALAAKVASPLLNNLSVEGDSASYRRTFWLALLANGGMAVLLAVALVLSGDRVLRLFGKGFAGPTTLIALACAGAVVEVVAGSLYQAIFTGRSLWTQVVAMSVWAGVLLISVSSVGSGSGAQGLAFSYLTAWCASACVYAIYIQKRSASSHATFAIAGGGLCNR
jgi:O-antigen/teichoic acid export membrane protein